MGKAPRPGCRQYWGIAVLNMLHDVQWVHGRCPHCNAPEEEGHLEMCELDQLICEGDDEMIKRPPG
jgi:hypothetical protein